LRQKTIISTAILIKNKIIRETSPINLQPRTAKELKHQTSMELEVKAKDLKAWTQRLHQTNFKLLRNNLQLKNLT
jgi:hypothetical protein